MRMTCSTGLDEDDQVRQVCRLAVCSTKPVGMKDEALEG